MKKATLILMLFLGSRAFGQAIVSDPVVEAQTLLNGTSQNSRLDQMNQHQTVIETAQLAAVTNLTFINDVQTKIYDGLHKVSSAISSAKDIIMCGQIIIDIGNYQAKTYNYASGNPLLLAFAEKCEFEFITRGYDLSVYIYTTIAAGGDDILMDSGDRARLIQHILNELRIMRGLAYGASQAVFMAKTLGIVKSLNPWQGYVNIDKQLFNEVSNNMKKPY